MTTTLDRPRVQLSTSLLLWLEIPNEVRKALKCRLPKAGVFQDTGVDCLIVKVGADCPLRLLVLFPCESGIITAEVHQMTPKGTKVVAEGAATGDLLPELLLKWGRELGL